MLNAPAVRLLFASSLASLAVLGALLAAPVAGAAPVPVTDQQRATDSFDSVLADQVQAVLDRIAGPGHALVTVNAVLDFTGGSSIENTYVHTRSVPPVAASIDKQSYRTGAGSGRSASATVDNSLGVVSRTAQYAPGRVAQLHIDVLLDRTRAPGAGTVRSVRSLVKAAVGFTARRGDTLSVRSTVFPAPSTVATATPAPASPPRRWDVVTYAGAGLIGALLVALVFVNRRRPRRSRR